MTQQWSDEGAVGECGYLDCIDEGQEKLLDALLRRGFLIFPKDGNLQFDEIPHPEDPAYLKQILTPVLDADNGSGKRLQILSVDGSPFLDLPGEGGGLEESCRLLRADELSQRIRGCYWYDESAHHQPKDELWSRESFSSLKFGTKVPVAALDPGVALTVKVLAWYGIATVESCEGHGKDGFRHEPHIAFPGLYHGRWAEHVLEQTFSMRERLDWEFENGGNAPWSFYIWYPRGRGSMSLAEHDEAMEAMYHMGRKLMNPYHARKMREEKERFKA